MKTLNLNEMGEISGSGPGRDCFISGVITLASVLSNRWLGALVSVGYAAGIGCFD